MPRTFLFSLTLFFGSAFWKLVPPLVFLLTGWRLRFVGSTGDPFFSSPWIQAGCLVFLVCGWMLLFGWRYWGKGSPDQNRLAAGIALLFLYIGYSLQHFMAEISTSQSQGVLYEAATWPYAAAGGIFLFFMVRPPRQSSWVLGATFLFLAALTPFVVKSFPFDKDFSDILLDIQEACRCLLRGGSPYGLEKNRIWEGGASYFPGLWLAYLPAVALNLDIRYLGTLYLGGFAFFVWKGMGPQNRPLGTWFLALFLLNPWLLWRHDTYLPAYLFVWSGFFMASRQEQRLAASLWYGAGLSMHLFSWALLPVWLVWGVKKLGFKDALKDLVPAMGVATVLILPFLIWDPRGFIQGTLIHFEGSRSIAVSHFGLAVWLSGQPEILTGLSIVALAVGAWVSWRGPHSVEALFRWLAVSLGLALLVSYHIEHYYYLVPLSFVLFHEIALLNSVGNKT